MLDASSKQRKVYNPIKQGSELDDDYRITTECLVSPQLQESIKDKLIALQDSFEKHFALPSIRAESPTFLRYRQNHFFKIHNDTNFNRRINVSIFLNNEMTSDMGGNQGLKTFQQNSYHGGSLTLYGILDKLGWQNCGFPIIGEAGLLVAYRSSTFHEVTPVRQGERFTIVCHYREVNT